MRSLGGPSPVLGACFLHTILTLLFPSRNARRQAVSRRGLSRHGTAPDASSSHPRLREQLAGALLVAHRDAHILHRARTWVHRPFDLRSRQMQPGLVRPRNSFACADQEPTCASVSALCTVPQLWTSCAEGVSAVQASAELREGISPGMTGYIKLQNGVELIIALRRNEAKREMRCSHASRPFS